MASHLRLSFGTTMKRSLDLTSEQRTALLDLDRRCPDPDVRFGSHILLLLGDGQTWATVSTLRYCSSRTIDRWVKRFHAEGVEAVAGHRPDSSWLNLAVEWVTQKAPRDFGFLRSRWCCEAVRHRTYKPTGNLQNIRLTA